MKIPKKVRIAGHDYKIIFDDKGLSKDNLIGDISNDFKEIRLCKYWKSKRARAQSEIERCLFHEILHGIDCHYNNDSLREKEVDRLANGLYQVLSDNFNIKTKKEIL